MESDPVRLIALVRKHIDDLGYEVLDHAPSDAERLQYDRIVSMTSHVSYGAFRSDPNSPPAVLARAGMKHLYGQDAPIIAALGVPAASVPTVNIDNNQHSPNENLRVGNFIEGIAILMSVLQQSPR
jgi:acetylornithine deacetylase/succinyl-diaminopimelate desuccinylase-like protein